MASINWKLIKITITIKESPLIQVTAKWEKKIILHVFFVSRNGLCGTLIVFFVLKWNKTGK